jgi:hypothetical protein
MSVDELVKSDMAARMDSLAYACRATCIEEDVEPPARLE